MLDHGTQLQVPGRMADREAEMSRRSLRAEARAARGDRGFRDGALAGVARAGAALAARLRRAPAERGPLFRPAHRHP